MNPFLGPSAQNLRYWPVENVSGEEIPAFACMEVENVAMMLGDLSYGFRVRKPTQFGSQGQHVFNGATPIPIGKYGVGICGDMVAALYDTSDGVPNDTNTAAASYNEAVGPRAGSWKLRRNTGGFACVSYDLVDETTPDDVIRVMSRPMLTLICKADALISKSTTGTVSIYWKTEDSGDAVTDTGVNLSIYSRYANIGTGKYLLAQWMPWERWEVATPEAQDANLYRYDMTGDTDHTVV